MSSSNWRPTSVEDDWEPCASETTNAPTTPPPKYSSFQMADNIGTGSSSTLQQENPQSECQIDLENGHLQSATPGLSWFGRICNRIPVKNICSHITPKNIAKWIGIAILGFLGLSAVVVGVVLVWDLVVYVVINRSRVCSKTD